jgi:hypothetical protein
LPDRLPPAQHATIAAVLITSHLPQMVAEQPFLVRAKIEPYVKRSVNFFLAACRYGGADSEVTFNAAVLYHANVCCRSPTATTYFSDYRFEYP